MICVNCGALLEVNTEAPPKADGQVVLDDWLCVLPTGFEWILPAGRITTVLGDKIYISGRGEHLTRNDYIMKYKIDPEIAYKFMRSRVGRFAAQAIAQTQPKDFARSSRAFGTNDLSDEMDWTY
ncbi:MAG: hypothetical protein MUO26_13835 [Methanotrichaceae archaeon]|nr:hypothetical protein [Methanotrichaceae archaeon]